MMSRLLLLSSVVTWFCFHAFVLTNPINRLPKPSAATRFEALPAGTYYGFLQGQNRPCGVRPPGNGLEFVSANLGNILASAAEWQSKAIPGAKMWLVDIDGIQHIGKNSLGNGGKFVRVDFYHFVSQDKTRLQLLEWVFDLDSKDGPVVSIDGKILQDKALRWKDEVFRVRDIQGSLISLNDMIDSNPNAKPTIQAGPNFNPKIEINANAESTPPVSTAPSSIEQITIARNIPQWKPLWSTTIPLDVQKGGNDQRQSHRNYYRQTVLSRFDRNTPPRERGQSALATRIQRQRAMYSVELVANNEPETPHNAPA